MSGVAMCDPVSLTLMAVGAATQVYGQVQQGKAQQRAANEQAAQYEYQALVSEDNALADAQLIRRQGRAARGQTVASVGASGIKIGEGSALDAERQVMQDTEMDAALAIMNGSREARGAREAASSSRRAGRDARRASKIAAFGTLLSSGAQGMQAGGFRSNGPGFSGGQAPAPVVDRSF
ncbi:MAG: virion core protein, T7 gp14 family, partial [Giesbergeria sp.]